MSLVIGIGRCYNIVPVFSDGLLVPYFFSTLSLQSRFLLFSSAESFLFLPASLYRFLFLFLIPRLCALCCGCAKWLKQALQAMEEMDSKPYQPLSKGRHEMEMSYTSSSDESEDGRAHHRSYTSRETLPDYTHELRLTLGSHRERQGNYGQTQPGTMHSTPGPLVVTLRYIRIHSWTHKWI